jgi:cytochrome c
MDSFEINKILGALLFTCLCLLSLNIAQGRCFRRTSRQSRLRGGGHEQKRTRPAARPRSREPIEKLLAPRTVEKGESAAKKCAACHTFGKGEPNRSARTFTAWSGASAARSGFNYSAGMKAKAGNGRSKTSMRSCSIRRASSRHHR